MSQSKINVSATSPQHKFSEFNILSREIKNITMMHGYGHVVSLMLPYNKTNLTLTYFLLRFELPVIYWCRDKVYRA